MFSRHPGRSSSGFTLIEILVICAILAILTSLLTINVRETMQQTERKASFADARSVANALTTAYFDIGFFPRVGYLNFAVPELKVIAGSAAVLPKSFDAMGFPDDRLAGKIGAVYANWGKGGSYLTISAERSNLVAGGSGGYLCKMNVPDLTTVGYSPLTWPADPWGNPYVVYLVKVLDGTTPVGPGGAVTTASGMQCSWIASPSEEPTYKALVVSYGPNGFPGGPADGKLPAGKTVDGLLNTYGLFRTTGTPNRFTALRSSELSAAQIKALSTELGYSEGLPGIMDDGSDDIYQSIR
jgi:type II secretory pathway pseudopilin PulG